MKGFTLGSCRTTSIVPSSSSPSSQLDILFVYFNDASY